MTQSTPANQPKNPSKLRFVFWNGQVKSPDLNPTEMLWTPTGPPQSSIQGQNYTVAVFKLKTEYPSLHNALKYEHWAGVARCLALCCIPSCLWNIS
ncbi:hypothetical protein NFI96_006699 [Prochilodus magdalenae]|nr:hypothetical protein NFI96_006699 [Prochilodus magdalenae]